MVGNQDFCRDLSVCKVLISHKIISVSGDFNEFGNCPTAGYAHKLVRNDLYEPESNFTFGSKKTISTVFKQTLITLNNKFKKLPN
jgi:hypothetical protein